MTPEDLLAQHGIKLESTAPGRHYTICPKCSAGRSQAHQKLEVLGVTITNDTAHWGCNHCNWAGPEKGIGVESGGKEQSFAATYDYADASGKVLFQKVRNPPGREPRFWCRQPDGHGGWIKGLKGVDRRPLYREPDVLEAIANGREIAAVEGEKDADRLWSIGLAATCNFDGAADTTKGPKVKPKWRPEYSERLRGARLVVFNDNDPQGYAHADAVCRMSVGIAASVRRLDLALHWPDIPKGGDVSDWLDRGHTQDELDALIAATPDYVPVSPSDEAAETSPSPPIDDDAEIERLARLPLLEYGRRRIKAAEALGVPASILERLVKAERIKLGLDQGVVDKQGRAVSFPEPEPWPEAVNGAELLDAVAAAIQRHVVLGDTARDTTALWVLHTYLLEVFSITPRLGVLSPTKRCGKTTLLDVLGCLVLRSLPTANVSPAAVFRVIEMHHPTLLVDEADTFIRDSDELRGVLNSGHRKGGGVLRTVGEDHEPRWFSTFGPCAVALIGSLPDTLHDRSVAIELKRRLKTEAVEPFRIDRAEHLKVLAGKAARWTADHAGRIGELDPELPAGVINREADNWRPLIAIADAAGGEWPQRARRAAEVAHGAGGEEGSSLIEQLLGDIQAVFAERGVVRVSSADLVEALVGIEGRPWAEMGKARKPLTQNRLARLLKPLRIAPENTRVGDKVPKGYLAERFEDAFARYGLKGASEPLHRYNADEIRTNEAFQTATDTPDVAVQKREKPNNDGHCSGVALGKGGTPPRTHVPPQEGSPDTNSRYMPLDELSSGENRRRPRTRDGFEVIGPEPDTVACTYCGNCAGETVYLIRDPFQGIRSTPLHEHCAPAWFAEGGRAHAPEPPPGLSDWRIRQLARAYMEGADAQYETTHDVDRTALDRELRATLAAEVLPEFVEVEFERVMQAVFAV